MTPFGLQFVLRTLFVLNALVSSCTRGSISHFNTCREPNVFAGDFRLRLSSEQRMRRV